MADVGIDLSALDLAYRTFINGKPIAQGSKRPIRTRSAGGYAGGLRVMDVNAKTLAPWRRRISETVIDEHEGDLIETPVLVVAEFRFLRPRSHYRTGKNAHLLRENAPRRHFTKPDGDKLARALGDALTATLLKDDSQISLWIIQKTYTSHPDGEGLALAVYHLH